MDRPAAAAVAAFNPGGTWEKKPVSAAAAATYQSWVLLDPTILKEDPAANSTAFTVCTASDSREVLVSLHLAEPPSSSDVQLRTDAQVDGKPMIIAADGDLLLIHMVVVTGCDPPFVSYEGKLFVYKSRPEPVMGRVRLLPQFANRLFPVRHTGIACRSKEFIMVGFHTSIISDDEEMSMLPRFSSSTGRWEALDLPIPFDSEKGLYKFVRGLDDMLALDGIMFWVDYHRGILYCNVFADSREPWFIQLPGIDIWDLTCQHAWDSPQA
ncbi:hypothetical protein BAE44_0000695, partial [Dichanthelium oligosanthes]